LTADHHALERELGDRYQIVRTLGRGAFGAVYLARERQLHRLVAIKVLHADRAWSDEDRARLLAEARTLANLSHPAVVPLLAFGETSDTVYMVMSYIGGETLADRLERQAAFEPAEVRRILMEIAAARSPDRLRRGGLPDARSRHERQAGDAGDELSLA
jgi:serine/threonine-protein kinase